MKAYKSLSNSEDLRLFRPDLNMKRLSNSMHRLSCPGYDFDKKELIECIAELVRVGKLKSYSPCINYSQELQLTMLFVLQTRTGFQKAKATHCTFDQL